MSRSAKHSFSKTNQTSIRLIAGLGVEDDAHQGVKVQHLSRVARDPSQPNLRQVHLMHGELLDELNAAGFSVAPGDLGENITTRGIDILELPVGACLRLGDTAVVEVTGLRNPCAQIERFQDGLLAAVVGRNSGGTIVRKSGIMGIVLEGGVVSAGDAITVELPAAPHRPLEVV